MSMTGARKRLDKLERQAEPEREPRVIVKEAPGGVVVRCDVTEGGWEGKTHRVEGDVEAEPGDFVIRFTGNIGLDDV